MGFPSQPELDFLHTEDGTSDVRFVAGGLKRGILDRHGLPPEGHRRRFKEMSMEDVVRTLAYAHQLVDAAVWWLRPEERSRLQVVDQ
ncbi:unnamed protein product, partial [Lota lota]